MKEKQDAIQDIAEIRSMMERSSRFLSLSGWAGVMAGVYALSGAWIAYAQLDYNPVEMDYGTGSISGLKDIGVLALGVLILALGTAIFLSYRKAKSRGEGHWNPTARQLLVHAAVPLIAGGLFIVILISSGLISLIMPCTLLFYGLALYNAGTFTYKEVKLMGLIEIGLGLLSACFIEYGLLLWALGFGVVHIIYGLYLHYKYEK